MPASRILTVLAFFCVGLLMPAYADLVYLTNGSVIEGKVTRRGGLIYVERPTGTVVLREDQVEHIERKLTPHEWFSLRLNKLLDNPEASVADFVKIGAEAQAKGYTNDAKTAFQEAIARDPDNPTARGALGYENFNGVWMKGDELKKAKGYVLFEGSWIPASEKAAIERSRAETKLLEAQAEVERAKAEIARAEADRAHWEAQIEREKHRIISSKKNLYPSWYSDPRPLYITSITPPPQLQPQPLPQPHSQP